MLKKTKVKPQTGQKTKSKTLVCTPGKKANLEFAALDKQFKRLQLRLQSINRSSRRSLLILNKGNLFVWESKARRERDRRGVTDIILMRGIPLPAGVKRVHRVGICKSPLSHREGAPRPILVELADEATRDGIFVSVVAIAHVTGGK